VRNCGLVIMNVFRPFTNFVAFCDFLFNDRPSGAAT
jgi:hypothetical protein